MYEPSDCTHGTYSAQDGSCQIGCRAGHHSSIVSQLVRKYIWHAVRTIERLTFDAVTTNDGEFRPLAANTANPECPGLR